MNRVCLIGRLTSKPELRYTSSNLPFSRFSIAINRTFNNAQGERQTDFVNIVVWRKQAENVCNFLDKGSQVSIEGRLQSGSYDGKDGQKHYTLEVVADSVQFLESKSQSQARAQSNNYQNNYSEPNNGPSPYDYQSDTPSNQGVEVADDPFADFGDSVSIDDDFLE